MKAIGISGYHHTGKTTLAVALIRALTARGLKVASIKDIHSEAYRADKEGSNSWKHAQAGAGQVFARGLRDGALILNPAPDFRQMLSLLKADFLVVEGLREAALPRIVCAENTAQLDELVDDTVFAISGKIAADLESYRGLPVFCLARRESELVDLVLAKAFEILPQSDPDCCSACGKSCRQMAADIVQGRARREDCVLDGQNSLTLKVGGEPVVIVPFVQNLLRDSILAFIGNLKGIDPAADIQIELRQ